MFKSRFFLQTDKIGNGLGGRGWLVLGDTGSLDLRAFNSFDCPNWALFKGRVFLNQSAHISKSIFS